MPKNVLEYVEVDHIVRVARMGPLLETLIHEKAPLKFKVSREEMKLLKMEVLIATHDNAFEMGIIEMGELTSFTCPDCHGSLARLREGNIIRFRCHTGHAFTASTLLANLSESVEEMLWQAMRGMEEMNILLLHIAKHLKELGHRKHAAIFISKSEEASHRARIIHDSVFKQEQYSEDIRFDKKNSKKTKRKGKPGRKT
jgi:two-component system chemotaxis response regulator CheB